MIAAVGTRLGRVLANVRVRSCRGNVSNKKAGSEANEYLSVSVKRSGYLGFGFDDYLNYGNDCCCCNVTSYAISRRGEAICL